MSQYAIHFFLTLKLKLSSLSTSSRAICWLEIGTPKLKCLIFLLIISTLSTAWALDGGLLLSDSRKQAISSRTFFPLTIQSGTIPAFFIILCAKSISPPSTMVPRFLSGFPFPSKLSNSPFSMASRMRAFAMT